MTSNRKIKVNRHLYEFVKKKVDLAEFLETEVGCKLKWYQQDVTAGTACPLHDERKPSFRIKFLEEDEIWIFHCLGCGKKGTIIDFFMDYYHIDDSSDAVIAICDKFDLHKDKDFLSSSFKDIKKKSDFNKKIEYTHILVSDQCRTLLRKNYSDNSKWVAGAYKRMNRALEKEDIQTIEDIGAEAFVRMRS